MAIPIVEKRRCRVRLIISVTAALTLTALSARAQTGQTAQIPLQFDFLSPGARSLALGSAFIAVADDATAAFTNPAGLMFLIRPEVSAEFRYRRLETPFLSGGRISGVVTNIGQDTLEGARYAPSIDSAMRPYFLSGVFPRRRWAVSAYRHELVRQENDFAANGTFQEVNFAGFVINNSRQRGLIGSRKITIDNYGGAVAYRFNDALSAGIGVSIYRFNITSDFATYGHEDIIFGPIDFDDRSSTTTQRGPATNTGVNAGILWTIQPRIRVGAVFRQGTSFDFTQVDTVVGLPTTTEIGRFQTPHVIGGGVRVEATERLTFAVDYDRVAYSRLNQDYIMFQVPPSAVSRVGIPDGNEVHGGIEYVVTNVAHTPAIRAGAWYDPDHAVHYATDGTGSPEDVLLSAIFPGGESVVHYSAGVGLPLSSQFEFNAGADFTKQRQYVSFSIVARFGK
jgi:long-chain fatty acid transport protein